MLWMVGSIWMVYRMHQQQKRQYRSEHCLFRWAVKEDWTSGCFRGILCFRGFRTLEVVYSFTDLASGLRVLSVVGSAFVTSGYACYGPTDGVHALSIGRVRASGRTCAAMPKRTLRIRPAGNHWASYSKPRFSAPCPQKKTLHRGVVVGLHRPSKPN